MSDSFLKTGVVPRRRGPSGVRQKTLGSRFRGNDDSRIGASPTFEHAVLDRPDVEQPGPRRPAVPARGRILVDLRADANRESHAWLVVHARRVSGRHGTQGRAQSLARRAAGRTVGRRVWRAARAVPSASAGRQRAGTGAGDAGHLVHRRRRSASSSGAATRSRSRRRLRCNGQSSSAMSPFRPIVWSCSASLS